MEHHFDIDHAESYGIEEAIIINHFIFWLTKNKANHKTIKEIELKIDNKIQKVKRVFTYNSVSAMQEIFPYMNDKKIYRVIESLIEQKVIVRKYFNSNSYNRTSWYCFYDESHFLKTGNGKDKKEKSNSQKQEMDLPETGNHYKDNNKDNETDNETDKEETPFPSQDKVTLFFEHHKKQLMKTRKHGDPDLHLVDKLGTLIEWDIETYDKILKAKQNSTWDVRRNQPNTAKWLLATMENENLETAKSNVVTFPKYDIEELRKEGFV